MTDRPILFTREMVRAILDGRKTQTRRMVKSPSRKHDHFTLVDYGDGLWPYLSDDGESSITDDGNETAIECPYGQPGDRLWVRETFAFARHSTDYATGSEYSVFRWEKDVYGPYDPKYLSIDPRGAANAAALFYKADGEDELPAEFSMPDGNEIGWTPSIHMPKWACRLWLELTDVRVERLQEISEADAIVEGVTIKPDAEIAARVADDSPARMEYWALWESINGKGSWNANPYVWVLTFRRVER